MSIYHYRPTTGNIFGYRSSTGAVNVKTVEDSTTDKEFYPVFVGYAASSGQPVYTDSALRYNPADETLLLYNSTYPSNPISWGGWFGAASATDHRFQASTSGLHVDGFTGANLYFQYYNPSGNTYLQSNGGAVAIGATSVSSGIFRVNGGSTFEGATEFTADVTLNSANLEVLGGYVNAFDGDDPGVLLGSTAHFAYSIGLGGYSGPTSTKHSIEASSNLHIDSRTGGGAIYLNLTGGGPVYVGPGTLVTEVIDCNNNLSVDGVTTLNGASTFNEHATFAANKWVYTDKIYDRGSLYNIDYSTATLNGSGWTVDGNLTVEGTSSINDHATMAASKYLYSDRVYSRDSARWIDFNAGTFNGTAWTFPSFSYDGSDLTMTTGQLTGSDASDDVNILARSSTYSSNDVTIGGYFGGTYANDHKIQGSNTNFYLDAMTGGILSLNHWCTTGETRIQDNGGNIVIGKDTNSYLTVNSDTTFDSPTTFNTQAYFEDGNTAGIACGSTTYGERIYIGGWYGMSSITRHLITGSSSGFHLDSMQSYALYLNKWSTGDIDIGEGGGLIRLGKSTSSMTVDSATQMNKQLTMNTGDTAAFVISNATYPLYTLGIGGWYGAASASQHRIQASGVGFHIDANTGADLYLNYYNSSRKTVILGKVSIGGTAATNQFNILGGDGCVDYEYYWWLRENYVADTNGQVGLRQTSKSIHSFWRNTSTNNSEYWYADNGTTTYTAVSDGRLKFDQKPLEEDMCTRCLMKLEPKTYYRSDYIITDTDGVVNEDGVVMDNSKEEEEDRPQSCRKECGFIAQDVLEIPELAHLVRKGSDTSPHGLHTDSILAMAVSTIQSLVKQNRRMENRILQLEEAVKIIQ